jgi:alpha-galactosidase
LFPQNDYQAGSEPGSAALHRGVACIALWISLGSLLPSLVFSADHRFGNGSLVVDIDTRNGAYTIATPGARSATVRAIVAAEIDHQWVKSSDYPRHELVESDFEDALGRGHLATLSSTGLPREPDLVFTIRVYETRAFGEIQIQIRNHQARAFTVQSMRSLQAIGSQILDLGANPATDRVLSDSFSEDWPPMQIYDLGKAQHGMHRAVGSQMVYNRQSKQSIFFGALTSDRWLTILHLETRSAAAGPSISHFTIDSTGTTEIQATDPESDLRKGSRENLIELSLPLSAGSTIAAESLMFAVGSDYHAQLETYGAAIRELHHSRIPAENMLGWWSWTAFYSKIDEGAALTNATWLAERVKSLGYDYFHFDLGYGLARGEYTTPNPSQFPHGMQPLTRRISQLGLKVGIWTAPFEIAERSSVYRQHKDWLVHNAKGEPIQITTAEEMPGEKIFVLDATNPRAQQFLRETYTTLVRDWGVKYIKLDFMDNTAIEGYYFRPDTTALEAQRIGLTVIRETVGDDVLLDKDGSPMLNPVGIVNDGRVSQDTGHTFKRSREAAPGIAARYYMHRNFFINDPDAFTVSRQLLEERTIQAPLTLDEAEVSIALSAVSGGLFEIGDDLPTLAMDADRVALIKNPDLLRMAKLGRAAVPIDLLSYSPEDRQPSVFLLPESDRHSMLAVFNWTDEPRARRLSFTEAGLLSGRQYDFNDALRPARPVSTVGGFIDLELPGHSVRLIRVNDTSTR